MQSDYTNPFDHVIAYLAFGIEFACGMCGAPCDDDGNQVPVAPDNYNPYVCDMSWCRECWASENEPEYVTVTRDMALDAGDPSLEGAQWKWN